MTENSVWTPETVIQYPEIQALDLAQDGQRALYTVREPLLTDDASTFCSQLYVVQEGGESLRLTYGNQFVSQPRWSPDGGLIAFLSNRQEGTNQLYVMNAAGGEAWPLTQGKRPVQQYGWSPDGNKLFLIKADERSTEAQAALDRGDDAIQWDVDYERARLWVIPLAQGDLPVPVPVPWTPDDLHVTGAAWLPDGGSLAYVAQPSPSEDDWIQAVAYTVSLREPGRRTRLATVSARPDLCVGPQGIAIVVGQEPASWIVNARVVVYPLDGGEPQVLAETRECQSHLLGWSADGQALLVMEFDGTSTALLRLPLDGATPDIVHRSTGFYSVAAANNQGRIAVVAQDTDTINYVALVDLEQGAETVLAQPSVRDWPTQALPRSEVVRWSHDAYAIEGLVTYPVGYVAGQRYSTLVMVHGGPAGVYSQTCVAAPGPYTVAAFAERGYVVLRANPRGSSGYGYAFRAANRRDWGGGDYGDIMAGLDMLIDKGIADPERLGIMGWSYGGYMTSWTMTQTDRFKAASVGAGVTNLMSFTGVSDITGFLPSYLDAEYWQDAAVYADHSAMFQIGHASTPTLIQHGDRDVRVPPAQSKELYTALKRKGVPAEMVIYPRQGHGLAEPRLIIDAMKRNLQWFDRWLMGEGKA